MDDKRRSEESVDSIRILQELEAPTHQLYPWEVKKPFEFLAVSENGHCFYESIALVVYHNEKKQANVRKELMEFLSMNRRKKWVRWICQEKEVEDYIHLHRKTTDEEFCSKKHWGRSPELILAARFYKCNFVLYQPREKKPFLFTNFSAEYETTHTPLMPGVSTSLIRYQNSHFDVVGQ